VAQVVHQAQDQQIREMAVQVQPLAVALDMRVVQVL
jgi:hypothetical protein